MDNNIFATDHSKISGVRDAFQLSIDTWPYAQAIDRCTNYADALEKVDNLITIKAHSNRHAARLSQTQHQEPFNNDYDDDINANHVNFRDVPPPGLVLHQDLRSNVLSHETLRLIIQERNEHLEGPTMNNGGGDTQNNTNQCDFNRTIVQLIIERIIALQEIIPLLQLSVDDTREEDMTRALHTQRNNLMGAISDYKGNIRQVRVTLDYYNINLSLSSENHYIIPIDNGADTCVTPVTNFTIQD
eukprot:scaffold55248_cov65-Attheya_sp.AAC.3